MTGLGRNRRLLRAGALAALLAALAFPLLGLLHTHEALTSGPTIGELADSDSAVSPCAVCRVSSQTAIDAGDDDHRPVLAVFDIPLAAESVSLRAAPAGLSSPRAPPRSV